MELVLKASAALEAMFAESYSCEVVEIEEGVYFISELFSFAAEEMNWKEFVV
jgi:hypothetical protein